MVTNDSERRYWCVHCGHQVHELYKDFKKGIIKICHCPNCGEVADKYIEYDPVIILLDVLLLQRPVYRHILLNSNFNFKGYWRYWLVLWLCDALAKLMQRKAGEPSPPHRLQPDHVFYSALEWHFYQDYLLSVAESVVFFLTVLWLLAAKHVWKHRNLKHFECEGVLKAVTLCSLGRLLLVVALVWGESYSTAGVTLTLLFVAASCIQALTVVTDAGLLQGVVVVVGGHAAQSFLLSVVRVVCPDCSAVHLPAVNASRFWDLYS